MISNTNVLAVLAASCALTSRAAWGESQNTCTGGYSATDVDGNGYVSPIEMNAYAKRQALEMDTDGSGSVSREEYVNCKKILLEKPAHPGARASDDLANVDIDQDGKVSHAEFMGASTDIYADVQSGDTEAADRAARMILVVKDMPRVDVSKIGLEEFAARSAVMFTRLDTDKDEALSKEEYIEKAPPPVDMTEVLNREFDEIDTDQSGDLSTEEMTAAISQRAERAIQASEAAEGDADAELGAPVVYYVYLAPM